METADRPVGFFDSGVGGLSVWQVFVDQLPNESTIYVGDTAYCPYGNRSAEEIYLRCEKLTKFLLIHGCKMIVVACNTATSAAIYKLREAFPQVSFVGMEPAIKVAAELTRSGHIGLLATRGTINGGHLKATRERFAKNVDLHTQIGEGLVELVEQQTIFTEAGIKLIKNYLDPMAKMQVDQLVLGCTHYPFLIPAIKQLYPGIFNIIEPSEAIAHQYHRLAEAQQVLSAQQEPEHLFFTTNNQSLLPTFTTQVKHFQKFELGHWKENFLNA